jgi:hypothetical protein
MITAVTIGFRAPSSDEATTATFDVNARTEAEAFEQATKKLQLQLIEGVLNLRPWADRYQFGS